ncbi:Sec-independent protein translocase protein TatB [soil metagenome]
MFDIGSTEFLLIIIVAVIVIGPKDLPRALYKVGQIVGKARGMASHFRTGIDAMMREAELAELEKKWASENQRIMQEHPVADAPTVALPAPEDAPLPSAMPGYSTGAESSVAESPATPVVETAPPKDGAPA